MYNIYTSVYNIYTLVYNIYTSLPLYLAVKVSREPVQETSISLQLQLLIIVKALLIALAVDGISAIKNLLDGL